VFPENGMIRCQYVQGYLISYKTQSVCNIQQIWLRILKYALVTRFTPRKYIFKVPPKRRKFLPFQLRKAAINSTFTAYAKQIISLFTPMLKVGL